MDLFSMFNAMNNGTFTAEGTSALNAAPKAEETKVAEAPKTEVKEEVKEESKTAPVTEPTSKTEVKSEEPKAAETKMEETKKDDNKIVAPDFGFNSLPPVSDDESDEDDSDDASDDSADDKKDKKPASSKKKETKLVGPVTVKGTGWSFTYGEDGKKYTGKAVLKACYEAGYKEVLVAQNYVAGENLIIAKTVSVTASDENLCIGDVMTVQLGNLRAEYKAEDFDGLTPEEISLFDLALKFQESHPDFKGCALVANHNGKIATPVFSGSFKPEKDKIYLVWNENGAVEVEGAALIESGATVYKSESDILFVEDAVDKKASRVLISSDDLGLEKVKANAVKELYRLPFTLFVETFGQKYAMTSEAFGGKDIVDEKDILEVLKSKYRMFRSSNRQIHVSYDKATSTVGVAVISGKKGAAAVAAAPSSVIIDFPMWLSKLTKRVEETELGTFRGYQNDETLEVSALQFTMKLPKIPSRFLDVIIQEFRSDLAKENMVQIYWSVKDQSYYMVKPQAKYTKVSVNYEMTHTSDILVMSIHSHNTMPAIFSSIDDEDEIYTGLFGVIGNLDQAAPSMCFRAGMEGCFRELSADKLFYFGGECA